MVNCEVIVDDEHFEKFAEQCLQACNNINETYSKYLTILNQVANSGITSGDTCDAILRFSEVLAVMDKSYEDIGDCTKKQVEMFLSDIDRADKYLY